MSLKRHESDLTSSLSLGIRVHSCLPVSYLIDFRVRLKNQHYGPGTCRWLRTERVPLRRNHWWVALLSLVKVVELGS